MKIVSLILFFLSLIVIENCSSLAYVPPNGSIFTSVTLNKDVSSATDIGSKSGEACTHNILYLFSFGEAGVTAAASNGGIKVVKAVDYSRTSFLSLIYTGVCTIARGD
jgi:hypothetical protein